MYLHPGGNTVITADEIIGIFDIDKTTVSRRTKEYLSAKEKQKKIVYCSEELPQSFIVTASGRETVYISQISSVTLEKRYTQVSGEE